MALAVGLLTVLTVISIWAFPLRSEQCSRSFAGAPLARYPSFA